jgi:SynChlorMet cassette protein ScmD
MLETIIARLNYSRNMIIHNGPITNPMIVLREEFDNWAFLFNPDTADMLVINPAGVVVWKAMNGKNSTQDILAELKEHFSEVPDKALDDVNAFIKDLETNGFVGFERES